MPDINNFTDRDILIRLDTKVEEFSGKFADIHGELANVKERLTELERAEDRRSGIFDGVKLLWGLLASLPVGTIAYLIGDAK